jgi:multicomponent Na+:H+ antiporter subunit C
MLENFFFFYLDITALILYGIGLSTLLIDRNLLNKILGMNIAYAAVYLFFVAKGYVSGRAPPIIVDGIQDASLYVNPIPTGLILTGIVISVSITAFSVALVISLYRRYQTLNLDEIKLIILQEEGD